MEFVIMMIPGIREVSRFISEIILTATTYGKAPIFNVFFLKSLI